ncbi:hypothetical protein [Streptomyces chattanoogensis]|uniref:hypothetical protein n=1 Tax=Streptomyces chattanoogensis TaxID=66876 RepID=UPI0006964F6E|nr:hypothetical protein T261_4384 [Streptomyces lydicus]
MSRGFRAHPDHLAKAAKEAHGHAEKVERFSSNLDAKTRGKLLGKGKFGMIVQKAVRPIIDSMITDMSKAMAKGHRSIGHGLDITRKNMNEAEEAIRKSMRHHQGDRDAVHLKPGDRVLNEDDVRDRYKKQVAERVEDLRKQGHGPQRHLDPTDEMLKERLGKPEKIFDREGNHAQGDDHKPKYKRLQGGYVETKEKVDPAHGPDARQRLGEDAYLDAEDPSRNHKCDAFSTAFNSGDDEAFMYAERHARSLLDPANPGRQDFRFMPEDAWGPGDHHDRFRGFYVDPDRPMTGDTINYKPVDFHGANLFAVFEPDGMGGHKLKTMFPEPKRERNT